MNFANNNILGAGPPDQSSKKDKIALIMWALVNNNVISKTAQVIFTLLDFILQLFLILSLYKTEKGTQFFPDEIESYLEFQMNLTFAFYIQVGITGYFSILTIILSIMIIKNHQISYETERNPMLKALSTSFSILRTFPNTFIILSCGNSINIARQDYTHTIRYVDFGITSISIVMFSAYTYLLSHFQNILIPIRRLPWAEISPIPFILKIIFKTILIASFELRNESMIVKFILTITAALVLVYKLLYRLRKSFQFENYNYIATYLTDLAYLHLLIFLQFSKIFINEFYLLIVTLMFPITVLSAYIFISMLKQRWFSNNIENIKDNTDKLISYLSLLNLFIANNLESQQQILQIMGKHLYECNDYFLKLERKMKIKYEQRKNMKFGEAYNSNEENDEQQLLMFKDALNNQEESINIDFNISSSRAQSGKSLSDTSVKSDRFSLRSTTRPFKEGLFRSKLTVGRDKHKPSLKQKNSSGHIKLQFHNNNNKNSNHVRLSKALQSFAQQINHEGDNKSTTLVKNIENFHDMDICRGSNKKIDKEIQKMLTHFFKKHLLTEQSKDYRLLLLRIYFTLSVMKQPYLAHFLLLDFKVTCKKDSFFKRTIKLINHHYLFFQIVSEYQQKDNIVNMNLQNLYELNKYQSKFENELESSSTNILLFWQDLLKERDIFSTFEAGLEISKGIIKLKEVYNQIQTKQQGERKETKFYMMMAAYYKLVIFKPQEFNEELMKFKFAYQNSKLSKDTRITNKEKGFILTRLNFTQLMDIEFINQVGCDITGYDKNNHSGLKINALMPGVISDHHHRFITKYLQSGKQHLINTYRTLFIKQRNGYVIPCNTFLFVNFLNQSTMIFIFEPDKSYSPDGGDFSSQMESAVQPGMLLCDHNLYVNEMTQRTKFICGLTYSIFDLIDNHTQRSIHLDDLFSHIDNKIDIKKAVKQGESEFIVNIKYRSHLNQLEETEDDVQSKGGPHCRTDNSKNIDSSVVSYHHLLNYNQTFTLKFAVDTFMGNQIEMYVVQIIPNQVLDQTSSDFSINKKLFMNSEFTEQGYNRKNAKSHSQFMNKSILESKLIDGSVNLSEHSGDNNGSTTSSTFSSVLQSYNNYHNSIHDQRIPKTLKLVLQLVISVIALMSIVSIISLSLTMINLDDARESIDITQLALGRLNDMRTIRLLLRHYISIGNGFIQNNDTYLSDKILFYEETLEKKLVHLLEGQEQLVRLDNEFEKFSKVKTFTLRTNQIITNEEMFIAQALRLYTSHVYDILAYAKKFGKSSLVSNTTFISIGNQSYNKDGSLPLVNQYEKQAFFIFYNSRTDMYERFRDDVFESKTTQKQKIFDKVKFSSTMSWVCLSIVIVCGLIIVPLINRIQHRILNLMQIFFSIDETLKLIMIANISNFKENYVLNFQKLITQHASQTNISKIETISGVQDMNQKNNQNIKTSTNNLKFNITNGKIGSNNTFKTGVTQSGAQQSTNGQMVSFITENSKIQKAFNVKERQSPKSHKKNKKLKDEDLEESKDERDDSQQEEDKHHKKRKHQHYDPADGPNPLDAAESTMKPQQQANLAKFRSRVSRAKLLQCITVFVISLFLGSYFIGTYFLSDYCFSTLSDGLEIMSTGFSRITNAQNAIYSIYETYVWNQTLLVNNQQDELMSFYINSGLLEEQDYQKKIIKERPSYLESMHDFIDQLEGRQFCEAVYVSGSSQEQTFNAHNVSLEQCREYQKGITQNGLSGVYYLVYQVAQQLMIEYQDLIKNGNATEKRLTDALNNRISPLMDVLYVLLAYPQTLFNEKLAESLHSYFTLQKGYFISLFVFFIFIQLLLIAIFILKLFMRWRKEMLLSNKLLYIIDFESIQEDQRLVVTDFLSRY